jgi:UDP-N-acetylglucosamine 2-epimerase
MQFSVSKYVVKKDIMSLFNININRKKQNRKTFQIRKKILILLIYLTSILLSEGKAKIVTIAGTRPDIIKLASIIPLLNNQFEHALVYTGQHFSQNMKDIFIDELDIAPDFDLKCNTSDIDTIKNKMLPIVNQLKPEYIVVYGDTNSSMAAALVAEKINSKIIHLEAGVRDFDYNVPEELIRIKIDEMANYLFAPSDLCKSILSYEQIKGEVYNEGNLIVDICKKLSIIAAKIKPIQGIPSEYLLLTIHRPENVDDEQNLKLLMNHFQKVNYPIVFPIHPRTKNNLYRFNIKIPPNVMLIDPVGYIEFLSLLMQCKLVLTDSGGVQEEAIILKKPCITLRHTSARWETILLKSNILYPPDRNDDLNKRIESMFHVKIEKNPYGENVAEKTMAILKKIIK